MAEALGFIGPLASGIGAAFGLAKGSPASNVQMPNYQQMQLPYMKEAASNLYSGTQNLQQQFNPLFTSTIAPAQQIGGQMLNDPYAALFQGGAGAASNLGINAALAQYGLGGQLGQAGQGLLGLGFDPQQQLYSRLVQQLQDQTRVGQAARGINMTPYGAGLENQAMSDFNINWQNAQLQRALQATQGAGGAFQTGAGMMAGAPGQMLSAYGMPYGVSQAIGGAGLGTLGQLQQIYGGAQQGMNVPLENYANYVQMGNQANAIANQAAMNQLQQANYGFQQQQTLGGQLGQALAGMSKGWAPFSKSMGWGA